MVRYTSGTRDDSADAGAFAAGVHGVDDRLAGHAYTQASPVYTETDEEIANNLKGGAGYFAEAHHTASFNVDAQADHATVRADRLGSHAFGSTDIQLESGEQYNPKFYDSAAGSYRAGAELMDDGSGLHAKYAGQTILVPSDQLDAARSLHEQHISDAFAQGDTARAQALQSIQFDDHIHAGGVESLPLTYADAQHGADGIRDGVLPDYAGSDTGLFSTGAEGALLAATVALVTSIGPSLIDDAANVVRGKMTPKEATERLAAALQSAQLKTQLGWASARGVGAAALTFAEMADPIGAALVVNLAIDAIQLSRDLAQGKMNGAQFGEAMLSKVADRGAYTALAAGAFWLMGPPGLLIPIIVKRQVRDQKMQAEALKAWDGAASAMREEFKSRLKSVDLLSSINQHYQNAQANTGANRRTSEQLVSEFAEIQKLLGYGGKASSSNAA